MTNKEILKSNKLFIKSCEMVDIPPTTRQASKWFNKKGLAYIVGRHKATIEMNRLE